MATADAMGPGEHTYLEACGLGESGGHGVEDGSRADTAIPGEVVSEPHPSFTNKHVVVLWQGCRRIV